MEAPRAGNAIHPIGATSVPVRGARVVTAGTMRLELDAPVRCGGDVVGKLADVVIDPVTRRMTHVVVQTDDKDARLVPMELVVAGRDGRRELALTCTEAELRELETIRE